MNTISDLIKLRRRVVVYLPIKKVKTRQLAADLLNLAKHNQATCLDLFIDKPSKKPKDKPELRRAVALCNDRNADLIIPDLGTLAQSIHFLAAVSSPWPAQPSLPSRPHAPLWVVDTRMFCPLLQTPGYW